ncbi:MAG TPA: ABC transporter ATP-binding protein [Gammaproteobacteria bacterium]|nr:ABC transporter ATP-binding protein [Gammaproteobacteria bacterium]
MNIPLESAPDPEVELRDISKLYHEGAGERLVLDGLSLELAHGETVAMLGRSGSGKSTVLNIISGIDAPSGGEVIIDGTRLNRLSEQQRTLFRRRHIGLVFQFFNLIPTLTVAENLLLPLELNGTVGAEQRSLMHTLLERTGMAGREASYPDTLSGGEQQRVAISRAVIHRPRLLLADEPTGNLDEETGRRILALLREMAQTASTTMLLVTHSEAVARNADRVVTLSEGRLHPWHGSAPP